MTDQKELDSKSSQGQDKGPEAPRFDRERSGAGDRDRFGGADRGWGDRERSGSRDRGDRDRSWGDRDRFGGPRPESTVKARLRARARKKARRGKKRMFQRRKVCRFCADTRLALDYKEAKTLRLFISETGKIIPRRISGNCAKHQRQLMSAIKRARHIAWLPYAANHL